MSYFRFIVVMVNLVLLAVIPHDVRGQAADYTDRPLRAIHISGNWGTNRQVIERWDPQGAEPLVPFDYLEYLKRTHVDWIGISVALHYRDSMDSTVERAYSTNLNIPTFSDAALRQLIREFREHGFEVYLTLAFESHEAAAADRPVWRDQLGDPGDPDTGAPPRRDDDPNILPEHWPWRPTHPDHDRFVAEFWRTYTEQAVHFARLAQAEGVRMYSLGTETDALFRTRSGADRWVNDFHDELSAMVDAVRAEYDGLLTYDMHYSVITDEWHAQGWRSLWQDLDLDVVGVSAWFPLVEARPSTVSSVAFLRQQYERIFQDRILPLAARNAGRPVVFTEYGAIDTVWGPAEPAVYLPEEEAEYIFSDMNGNGIDDGRETQANVFRALFETMNEYPGVVYGAFFWDNWIASDEHWQEWAAGRRNFDFRNKEAHDVVLARYDAFRSLLLSPARVLFVGGDPVTVPVASRFPDASAYRASSSAPGVAAVSVSGSHVVVAPVAEGEAAVTVVPSGTDRSARLRFTVMVVDTAADRNALEALHVATGGDNWRENDNWLSDAPLSRWHGVDVNGYGRVTELRLENNGLAGPVPAELGNLAHLRELRLSGNALTGTIPATLANLADLTGLLLWGETWTREPAPEWLGNLTNLRWVDLGGHQLTGPIPATWRNLSRLEGLYLGGNALTGSIPGWFGNLASLRGLHLDGNPLTGRIPPELGNLSRLTELSLGLTVLGGPIPGSLTRLPDLSRFSIEGTGICVPDDAALQAWLAAIPQFISSGLDCEESPAPVTVAFEQADYTVAEGESTYVRMRLSDVPTPRRSVSIGVTAAPGRGATAADYRVPGTVTFWPGAVEAAVELAALRDADADDGETVTLGFGGFPTGVAAGTPATATVTISDPTGNARAFTDDPIRPGTTPLKAIHFLELRTRIAALREREGLAVVQWTDLVLDPGVTPVRRVHLVELRDALDAVHDAAGRPRPQYADAAITAGVTAIKAVHVMELRQAILALE